MGEELRPRRNNDLIINYFLGVWRRGRDSNPREPFEPYSLSRGAPSTTRPPLQEPPINILVTKFKSFSLFYANNSILINIHTFLTMDVVILHFFYEIITIASEHDDSSDISVVSILSSQPKRLNARLLSSERIIKQ